MLDTVKLKLIGTSPLLQHNNRLADPTSRWSKSLKALTGKRNKTDDDFMEIKRTEWIGGLWQDSSGKIAVSADHVLALAISGARKLKLGKLIQAGVIVARESFPLIYDGPKDIDKLFSEKFCDYRPVKVGQSTTMRARPRFDSWAVEVEVLVDNDIIDSSNVVQSFEIAGRMCGLGDYRPRYGRFEVEIS